MMKIKELFPILPMKKGNETVEWACSLPQLAPGRNLQVSGQVHCQDRREPLGVVASIVPFNFVSNEMAMRKELLHQVHNQNDF